MKAITVEPHRPETAHLEDIPEPDARDGYCSEPMTSGEITLPAMRTMNSSPKLASNTSSGGTRESLQPMIVAYGR